MQQRTAPRYGTSPRCANVTGTARRCSDGEPVRALAAPGAPPPLPAQRSAGAIVLAFRPRGADWLLGPDELTRRLLALARGRRGLERARLPGEVAAAFLRRYDARRPAQEACARELAAWLVWAQRGGVDPFRATPVALARYLRDPSAADRSPAALARRRACLAGFYRRAADAGLIERGPVGQPPQPRPHVPGPAPVMPALARLTPRDVRNADRRADPRTTSRHRMLGVLEPPRAADRPPN